MVLSITIFELDRNNSICRQQSALYIVRLSHSIQLRTSDPAELRTRPHEYNSHIYHQIHRDLFVA
jgi:hypothetical protein